MCPAWPLLFDGGASSLRFSDSKDLVRPLPLPLSAENSTGTWVGSNYGEGGSWPYREQEWGAPVWLS